MIWKFNPDWSDSYQVTSTFNTEVLSSRSNVEQRRALRQSPRKSYQFKITESGSRFQEFKNFMNQNHGFQFVIPDAVRKIRLAVSSGIGATSVTIQGSSAPTWLVANAYLVIGDGDQREIVTVSGTPSGLVINLVAPLTISHSAGSWLYFGAYGRIPTRQGTTRLTSDAFSAQISFDQTVGYEVLQTAGSEIEQFNGREVFTHKPNWSSTPDVEFGFDYETVDYDFGVTNTFQVVPFKDRIMSATYLDILAGSALEIEKFFYRRRGRQKDFYLPTYEKDITLKSPVSSGSSFIVAGTYFAAIWANDITMKAIRVEMRDGTYFYRLINSITISGPDSIVSLTANIPWGISPENVNMISWMPVVRFGSDTLVMEWVTSAFAQTKIAFQTLPAFAAE